MVSKHIRLAIIFMVLPILGSCSKEAPREIILPVTDFTATGGVGNGDGWQSVGSVASRPALSLYVSGRPLMVITCKVVSINLQVRGFEPKQAWPQPDMLVRFGTTLRNGSPDVRNIGNQVAYEIDFRIADDVLKEIRESTPIIVEFNGQTRSALPIPADQARVFAERCASLVPPGMRQSNVQTGIVKSS